jgi:hypothetical protein
MYEYFSVPKLKCCFGKSHQVVERAMDAPCATESDQMECCIGLQSGYCVLQGWIFTKSLISDRPIYPEQVLLHNPASPDIQMADFGVSHLIIWKTYSFTKSDQLGIGEFLKEPVEIHLAGGSNSVVTVVRIVGKAIQNDECERCFLHRSYGVE